MAGGDRAQHGGGRVSGADVPSAEKRTEPAAADAVGLGDVVAVAVLGAAGAEVAGAVVDGGLVDDGEVLAVATLPASGPVQAPAARSTARAASTGAAACRRVMTAV